MQIWNTVCKAIKTRTEEYNDGVISQNEYARYIFANLQNYLASDEYAEQEKREDAASRLVETALAP